MFVQLLQHALEYVFRFSWRCWLADSINGQMGPVLDAACCAGTCHQPTDIVSLDYNNVRTTVSMTLGAQTILK